MPASLRYPFSAETQSWAESAPSGRRSRNPRPDSTRAATSTASRGGSEVEYSADLGSLARWRGARGGSVRAEPASRKVRGTTQPTREANSSR